MWNANAMQSAILRATTIAMLCAACAPRTETDGPEPVGEAVLAVTVDEAAAGSCSTGSVEGLSLQIIARGNCIAPGAFVEVPPAANLGLGSNVFPFLEEPARDALVDALAANPGMTLGINSMLRTVAQQYLLYGWSQSGQCGIGLAATPGNSNHETGLAFDTSDYSAWQQTLEDHGFAWYGSGDAVHFDYAGPDAVDYRGTDVLAFQELWNLNNPIDPIADDGAWGPQTEARMGMAPAEGFPDPGSCGGAGGGGAGSGGASSASNAGATTGASGSGGDDGGGGDDGAFAAGPSEGAGCACVLPRPAGTPHDGRAAALLGLLAIACSSRRRGRGRTRACPARSHTAPQPR